VTRVAAIALMVAAMLLAMPATGSSPQPAVTPVVGLWLVGGDGRMIGPAW
jgi:hypothetical protein